MNFSHQNRVILNVVKDILLLLLAFLFPLSSFADTTFVSGAVSGEWTRDGNPYIVVDSTWVPEGERLTLTAGVEAFFNEGQGLYVFGTMNAEGQENDSVRIRVSEGVEHWKGIRFQRRDQSEWYYCTLVCPDTAIYLAGGFTILFEDCTLEADTRLFEPFRAEFGWTIDLTNSHLYSRAREIRLSAGRITARNCSIDVGSENTHDPTRVGVFGDGTTFYLENTTIIGDCSDTEPIGNKTFLNCRILKPDDFYLGITVNLFGRSARMEDCYIEGNVDIELCPQGSNPITIARTEITGELSRDDAHETPFVIDSCNIGTVIWVTR